MKHLSFTILLICSSLRLFAQCQTNIDFNTWIQEGYTANGDWNVQGGGTNVFQTINGDPTFYVSPDTFLNVRIQGRIRVEDQGDDDFIGFVFGFKEPEAVLNQYDFFLFDWKRRNQNKGNTGQFFAQEGFSLSRVNGVVQPGIANYWPSFWAHDPSATCTPIDTEYGNTLGWEPNTNYDFTLLYTPTRVTILINADTIFDVPGCYEQGRFGFYNYSQPSVRYSDFSYTLISNFEVAFSNYDQCMNVPVNFIFTDSTCTGGASATSNIAAWDWDFADGSTGNQTNPDHTYTAPGVYPVKLVVTDVNGCQDSVTKNVTVHPPPLPTVVADTVLCPSDSVALQATGGITYSWTPAAGLSNPNIANPQAFPSQTTLYTLTVTDQFNCEADTQLTFYVFNATDGPDLTICAEDTIALSAPGGVAYQWSPTVSLDNPNVANPNAFPLQTTQYQAIVSDPLGCQDTAFQNVSVNPLPIVSASPDTSVCIGESVNFSASGANTYQWFDASGSVLGTSNPLSLTANTTGLVIALGTDLNGCQAADTANLTVFPLPIVDAGPDFAICEYEVIQIGSANNPAGTVSWSTQQLLNDSTLFQPQFTPTGAGVFPYLMSLTDLNGCTNVDSMQIRKN
ncbi:MAG: PKD domain-containing protein, partial [Bacteroidota bacterium]